MMKRLVSLVILIFISVEGMEYKPSTKMEIEEPSTSSISSVDIEQVAKKQRISSASPFADLINQFENLDPAQTKLQLTDLQKFQSNDLEKIKLLLIKKYQSYWISTPYIESEIKTFGLVSHSVSYSPDGTRVATDDIAQEKGALIWDVRSGKVIKNLPIERVVSRVQYSSDGSKILTYSYDTKIRIWDASSWTLLKTIDPKKELTSVSFNSDASKIVSCSRYESIIDIWSVDSGNLILTIIGKTTLESARFNPNDSEIVVSQYYQHAMTIWDAKTGILRTTITTGEKDAMHAVFDPTDDRILACEGNDAKVFDAHSGIVLLTLPHSQTVYSALYNAQGSQIVTASYDKTAKVWNSQTGDLLFTMKFKDPMRFAQFDREGTRVLTLAETSMFIWSLTFRNLLAKLAIPEMITLIKLKQFGNQILRDPFYQQQWRSLQNKLYPHEQKLMMETYNKYLENPQSSWLASLFGKKETKKKLEQATPMETEEPQRKGRQSLFQLAAKVGIADQIPDLDAQNTRVLLEGLSQLPDDRKEIIKNQIITKYPAFYPRSYEKPFIEKQFPTPTGFRIFDVSFSPDGTKVAASGIKIFIVDVRSGQTDHTVKVWDEASGNLLSTLPHVRECHSAFFNHDDSRIITTTADNTINIWNAAGQLLLTIPCQGTPSTANFSPDDSEIIAALSYTENPIVVSDSRTGALLNRISIGYDKEYIRVATFNPQGSRILAGINKNAMVYDAITRKVLVTIPHQFSVDKAEYDPSGLRILTAMNNWTNAGIWDAESGKLLFNLVHKEPIDAVQFNPKSNTVLISAGYDFYIWNLPVIDFYHKLSFEEIVTMMKMKQFGTQLLLDSFYKNYWDLALAKLNRTEQMKAQELYYQEVKESEAETSGLIQNIKNWFTH